MNEKYEYKETEFVKVYRKFLRWEWYDDINTKVLFIHCLLRAHWHEGDYKGIHYMPGQFITSLESLSQETGLSVQNIRTALKHLISTGELTSTLTSELTRGNVPECRIITVNNWDKYQGANKGANKQSTSKLTRGQQEANNSHRNSRITPSKKEEEPALPASSDEDPAAAPEDEDDGIDFGAMNMSAEEFERWMKNYRESGNL